MLVTAASPFGVPKELGDQMPPPKNVKNKVELQDCSHGFRYRWNNKPKTHPFNAAELLLASCDCWPPFKEVIGMVDKVVCGGENGKMTSGVLLAKQVKAETDSLLQAYHDVQSHRR